MPLKIRYNAPVTLTFGLLCIGVYILNYVTSGSSDMVPNSIMQSFFVLNPNFSLSNPFDYFRTLSYTFGHASSGHIMGNMSLLLLIAPIMEEKYGSAKILVMMLSTALITALFQLLFFDTGLLGASGLVFMFIVLVSFADAKKGSIPLTFLLVVLFYLGQEFMNALDNDNTSQFAHIAGGLVGALFGFGMDTNQEEIEA